MAAFSNAIWKLITGFFSSIGITLISFAHSQAIVGVAFIAMIVYLITILWNKDIPRNEKFSNVAFVIFGFCGGLMSMNNSPL